jgi:hypothetical protein
VAVDGEARGQLVLGRQAVSRREDLLLYIVAKRFGDLVPDRYSLRPNEIHRRHLRAADALYTAIRR